MDLFPAVADAVQRIDLPGADVRLWPQWLAGHEADALLEQLACSIVWERHHVRLFGREHAAPRLSCWIGDEGARYTYSGTRFEPRPWPVALDALRQRVSVHCGVRFNSVLANLYRNGDDAMGWHSDDEPELGEAPVIASLSLGETRRFRLRHRRRGGPAVSLDLPHGSLLVMAGNTQRHYRHALPRTRRIAGPRLNFTFRQILGG